MAEKKKPRRKPITPATSRTVREMETLAETPANRGAIKALADVIALWVHHAIRVSPSSAAIFYRALVDAWRDCRAAEVEWDATRERETCAFNSLFYSRLDAVVGRPVREPVYPSEKQGRVFVLNSILDTLLAMFGRLPGDVTPPPPSAPAMSVAGEGKRIEELREELRRIERLPENEAARFAVETELYKLETAGEPEEWPELIGV
jgi:hypothetical protein